MSTLSKISQDTLLDVHQPLGPVDEDNSSAHESVTKGQQIYSIDESDSNSRTGSSRTGATDEEMNLIKDGLAREETKYVFRLRILVILILLATAIAMSYTIYHISHHAQVDEFQSEFEGVANAIIASLNGKYIEVVVSFTLYGTTIGTLYLMDCRIPSFQISRTVCLRLLVSP
jgi:hypothetical protein